MKKNWRILIFVLIVFAGLVFLSHQLETKQGTLISELEFTTYDNVLYTPDELHNLTEEERASGHVGWDYEYHSFDFTRLRTNILELELTPGEVYGIHCEQFTYAAKMWVDGNLLVSLGEVSSTPKGFVPHTGSVTVYFTAGDRTEIVTQRCSYDHAKWNAFQLYLGPQDVITRQVQNEYFKITARLVILLTIGVMNLGMYAGFPGRREFLWLSMSAFSLMLNDSFNDPKLVMLVFPKLNWYLGHRLESGAVVLLGLSLFLLCRACFSAKRNRFVTALWAVFFAAALLYHIILPVRIYTRYGGTVISAAAGCYAVWFIFELVRNLLRWKMLKGYQRFALIGFGIVILAAAGAALHVGPSHLNTVSLGMILFELVLSIGFAVEFRNVQDAFSLSLRHEEELQKMNETMEQNQELQENFMAIMNHEMRTPLTVIAGYAELSASQLREIAGGNDEMIRSLQVIQQEALRLGRIVEQSEDGARTAVSASERKVAAVRLLFEDAKAFCQPICEKRSNRIEIDCPAELMVCCMRDSMLQALYNLILNASRHTQNGRILLAAESGESEVLLRVCDDGDGMDDETMNRAFERGFTKDNGHGLGLALCREIMDRHNGRIWIERTPVRGITVWMALPDESE